MKPRIYWKQIVSPVAEVKESIEGKVFRLLLFAVGRYTSNDKHGWVALYRTCKAFYLRVWNMAFAIYLPTDEGSYREFIVWPRSKRI